jgi:hypothetical protein
MTIKTRITFYLDGRIDYETREYHDMHGPNRVVTELYVEYLAGHIARIDRCVQIRDGDGSAAHPIYLS